MARLPPIALCWAALLKLKARARQKGIAPGFRHLGLGGIVSKFIGETEKHLDGIFVTVERSGAVLLFDEADALFSKRSEVKDAHDRYANADAAHLISRFDDSWPPRLH